MKKVVIIQARMGSTRFPGKVLTQLKHQPILQWVVNAAQRIHEIDQVMVATSDSMIDNEIADWCKEKNIAVFRGDENDVLARYYGAANELKADVVLRITADCPYLDSNIASQVLALVVHGEADYASNIMPATWPDGLDCEAFTFQALELAHQKAKRPSDREHVTPYLRNNHNLFKTANLTCPLPKLYNHRWTVDTLEDLTYLNQIALKLKNDHPSYIELLSIIKENPSIKRPEFSRNEGFEKSLALEQLSCQNFEKSQDLLDKILKVIPMGAQTFSKSHIQYPKNTAPLILTHGNAARVWDIDGNEYIDLVNALLPNVLGYTDPDINYAIQNQLSKGISFSLAIELELQLAEKLCQIIPSAERVQFAKNGSDVTSAAIRISRAFTNRDRIIVCGYHGWQDWYIGTTSRNLGVPKVVSELTASVPYNDLEQLEILLKTEQFAAVIMEPCNATPPKDGYLLGVKNLCEKFGSVLIFDEIITGFRFAIGGAQQYFNVTPHLSCFGKAMGNGMPISAIVGRADIMNMMKQVFFSGTFGGEALSLTAAMATIDKIQENNVIPYLWTYGQQLKQDIQAMIDKLNLSNVISFLGYSPWMILKFHDYENIEANAIKTYFMQEMIQQGILILSSHNISYALGAAEHRQICLAYKGTLEKMSELLKSKNLLSALKSPILEPLFKVR